MNQTDAEKVVKIYNIKIFNIPTCLTEYFACEY